MLKTHPSISIPDYVLSNYKKLGVTDAEFICLLHFLAIDETGKSAWQIVSERMGYTTDATVTKLINSLVEKGLVELNGRGYDLDATKLWDAGLQMVERPETIEIIVNKKEKTKKTNVDYDLAKKIKQEYGLAWNLHSVAEQIKTLRSQGIPETDFLDWIHWMDSGNRWYAETKGVPKPSVRVDRMTLDNYYRWNELGRPSEYSTKTESVL